MWKGRFLLISAGMMKLLAVLIFQSNFCSLVRSKSAFSTRCLLNWQFTSSVTPFLFLLFPPPSTFFPNQIYVPVFSAFFFYNWKLRMVQLSLGCLKIPEKRKNRKEEIMLATAWIFFHTHLFKIQFSLKLLLRFELGFLL